MRGVQSGYELIRRLAAGGMGEVFVARRTGAGQFEKRVALKLLLPHLVASPELVQRFYAEARLAARMHHPNIVEIFDVGVADGRPFLAMQLVEGVSLQKLNRVLKERGEALPLPLVRLLATGVCEALGYAHALKDGRGQPLKLVHRDVTPSNILVSSAGAVLLTDFGIARVQDDVGFTNPGEVRGKAAYLAPEQLSHEARVDARADLYSAALTLYEVLTGENPYRQPTMKASMLATLSTALPPVTTKRPDVTPGFAAALHRALARHPDQRFPDATSFREALMDGPVATAPELAAEVRRLCGDGLFEATRDEAEDGPGTRSIVVTVTPTVLEMPAAALPPATPRPVPPARRRGLVGAAAAVAVALLSVGGWGLARGSSAGSAGDAAKTDVTGASSVRGDGTSGPTEESGPKSDDDSARTADEVRPLGATPRTAGDGARPGDDGDLPVGDSASPKGTTVGLADDAPGPVGDGTLPAGDHTRPLDATARLTEDTARPGAGAQPGDARPPQVSVAPTTPRPRPPRPSRPSSPASLRVGYLTADAVPWAEVLLDGRLVERTPFARFPVPVGRHTLTFRGPDGRTQKRTVTILEGAVTPVRVEF